MSDEIKVAVIAYPDRENLVLAYTDPVSGKRKTKSAGTSNEKKAWKAAAKWEEELLAGPHCPPSKVTWAEFRTRYEEEHLASLSKKGRDSARFHLRNSKSILPPIGCARSAHRPYRPSKRSSGQRASGRPASPVVSARSKRRYRGRSP